MKSFIVKLKEKREIARETMEFVFEKPKGIKYEAGQYVLVTLLNPKFTDIKGNTRAMSIATAPSEDYVSIAMRMSDSAFKRSLDAMQAGEELEIQGPLGHLIIPKDEDRHIVFLAGGIGVVPFRSMMIENLKANWDKEMTLIHSNHTPEDISYYEEFEKIAADNEKMHVVNTISSPENYPDWSDEKGRINADIIRRAVVDPIDAKFFIVGIPAMVQAMQNLLIDMGVPYESIQVELFGGY